jgi:hypothetical protein
MSALGRRWLLLFAPLVVLGPLRSLVPEPVSLGQPRSCARAQLIEGELRCDEELETHVGERCPGLPELAAGDAVDACVLGRMPPADLAALAQAVDINHASVEELTSLPGIGPAFAAGIVAGRPYAAVEDLLRVRGIGPKRLQNIEPRARVTPP